MVIDTGTVVTGFFKLGERLDSTPSVPTFCMKFSLAACPLHHIRQGFIARTMYQHRPKQCLKSSGLASVIKFLK
jgi:hypothetical protein